MKIAVLGTGMVGQAFAGRLAELGHDVVIGTRDPQATLTRTEPDGMGNPPVSVWHALHSHVPLLAYADAAAHGDLLVNATSGGASLSVLEAAGDQALAGKVLLDVANPLDFSNGFPPSLSVVNTDSLAEQLQRAHPALRVVKSLNTMNCLVMVDPKRLGEPHTVFVAGDDPQAKDAVKDLLAGFGWPSDSMLDLGGLSAARGTEMFLPLWLSLMQTLGTGDFNVKIVKA